MDGFGICRETNQPTANKQKIHNKKLTKAAAHTPARLPILMCARKHACTHTDTHARVRAGTATHPHPSNGEGVGDCTLVRPEHAKEDRIARVLLEPHLRVPLSTIPGRAARVLCTAAALADGVPYRKRDAFAAGRLVRNPPRLVEPIGIQPPAQRSAAHSGGRTSALAEAHARDCASAGDRAVVQRNAALATRNPKRRTLRRATRRRRRAFTPY